MLENARQGLWICSAPPFGYRIIELEEHSQRVKKHLERWCSVFWLFTYRLEESRINFRATKCTEWCTKTARLSVTTLLALPGFTTLFDEEIHDCQRSERVNPPRFQDKLRQQS